MQDKLKESTSLCIPMGLSHAEKMEALIKMSNKYTVGTKLICNKVSGVAVENFKFAGDICVEWETGLVSSYDKEWLDENVTIS